MPGKVQILVGAKLETSEIVQAANKMQEIIAKSGTRYDLKQTAEKQLKLIEEYSKKINRLMNKPKINQNDLNQLRTFNQILTDGSKTLEGVFSKVTAGASTEMLKIQDEIKRIQKENLTRIQQMKTAFSETTGKSFGAAPQILQDMQKNVQAMIANKKQVVEQTRQQETERLTLLTQANQQRIQDIEKIEQDILTKYNQSYNLDLKNFADYQNRKKEIEDATKGKRVLKQSTIDERAAAIATQRVKEQVEAVQNVLNSTSNTKAKDLKALGINGVGTQRDAKKFISDQSAYLQQQIALEQQLMTVENNKLAALKEEKTYQDQITQSLVDQNKAKQGLPIYSKTEIAQRAAQAGTAVGDQEQKKIDKQVSKMRELGAAYKSRQQDIADENQKTQALVANYEKQYKVQELINNRQFAADTQVVANALDQAGNEAQQNAQKMGTMGDEMLKASVKAQTIGKIGDTLNSTIGRLTSFYFIYRQVSRFIRDGIQDIKTLDDEITQIGIVTKQTGEQIWKTFDTFNRAAYELSTTTTKYLEGAKIFYQQGMGTTEVISMVAATTKIAALSEVDFKEASETLTAAIRGYNMEASEAESVTDKLAAVGASSAADFHELSVAMEKVAASAYTAGISFDGLLGLLGKGIETTKEAPEAIGTALKTIIARFQEMKENPMGELTEGGNANRVEKALKTIGVALRDTNGQFRDLEDVFKDLGGVWPTLTRNQKAYIATMAAGSRQQSRFMAIMNNYDRTLELIRTSMNSAGEAAAQYNIYQDSIAATQDRMKNSLENLYASFLKSDLIKGFYKTLDQLFQTLESLNPTLILTTSLIVGLGTKIFHVIGSISAAAIPVEGITKATEGLKGLQKVMVSLTGKTVTAASAQLMLNAAIAAFVIVIGIAIFAYTKMKAAQEARAQAVHKEYALVQEEAKTLRQSASSLETKIDRYKELRLQLVRTNEEQSEYLTLIKEIATIAPDLIRGVDEQGNYILAVGDELTAKVKEMESIARDAERAAVQARIASMKAAEWNAEVSGGAPGESTAELSQQMSAILEGKKDTSATFWKGGIERENNILLAGMEQLKTQDQILADINAQRAANAAEAQGYTSLTGAGAGLMLGGGAALATGVGAIPGGIAIGVGALATAVGTAGWEGLTLTQEELDAADAANAKWLSMYTNYLKVRLVETKSTMLTLLNQLSAASLEELEASGVKVTDEYQNVLSGLSLQSIKMATQGIDEKDLNAQRDAILNNATDLYNSLAMELEKKRGEVGFQRELTKIFDLKKSGVSVNDLQKSIKEFLAKVNIPEESDLGKALALSIFNPQTFDNAMQTLVESLGKDAPQIIAGKENFQTFKDAFGNLSAATQDYFMNMFDYLDEGPAKTELLQKFGTMFSDPKIATTISEAYKNLDTTSATEVWKFNQLVAETLSGTGATAEQVSHILSILASAAESSFSELNSFVTETKTAYENIISLQEIAKKSASGLMTLGDALDYVSKYGEEAALALEHVGDVYFISFSEIVKQMRKQQEQLITPFDTLITKYTQQSNDLRDQIKINVDQMKTNTFQIENPSFEGALTKYISNEISQLGLIGKQFNSLDEAYQYLTQQIGDYKAKSDAAVADNNQTLANLEQQRAQVATTPVRPTPGNDNIYDEAKLKEIDEKIRILKQTMSDNEKYLLGLQQIATNVQKMSGTSPEIVAIINDTTTALQAENDKLKTTIFEQQMEKDHIDALSAAFTHLKQTMEETSRVSQEAIINKQEFMDSVSAINAGINGLTDYGKVLDQIKDGGLTFLDTMKLIGDNPDLLAAMEVTNGQIKITEAGLIHIAKLKKSEVQGFLDGEVTKLQAQYDVVNAAINGFSEEERASLSMTTLGIAGEDAVADAAADGTKTYLENLQTKYNETYKFYELLYATAQLEGRTLDKQIAQQTISTDVSAISFEPEAIVESLKKKYGIDDLETLLKVIKGELDAAQAASDKWRSMDPVALLEAASGGGKAGKDFEAKMQDMDRYINYLEQIAHLESEIAELDAKIALESTGGAEDLDLLKEKGKALAEQLSVLKQLIAQREKDMSIERERLKWFSKGLVTFDSEGIMQVNWEAINSFVPANEAQQEWIDALVESIQKYQDAAAALGDYNEQLTETEKLQEDLYNSILDRAIETRQSIYDALVEADQREIDELQKKYEKMTDMENNYLNALKNAIDEERKAREQSQAAEDLAQKKRKLATLQRDTSGMFAKDIAALLVEIRNEEQTLRDQEIDRQYEILQKQYEVAQEQRDLQIQSLEEQMTFREESGYYWEQVDATIKAGPDAIVALLQSSSSFTKLDPLERIRTAEQIQQDADYLYKLYKQGLGTTENKTVISAIEAAARAIAEQVANIDIGNEGGTTPGGGSNGGNGGNSSGSGSSTGPIAKLQTALNKIAGVGNGLAIDNKSGPMTRAAMTRLVEFLCKEIAGDMLSGNLPYAIGLPWQQALVDDNDSHVITQNLLNMMTRYMGDGDPSILTWLGMPPVGTKYKKGGVVDYTGPAWVHGSSNNPETFLNAKQTTMFAALRDVLQSYRDRIVGPGASNSSSVSVGDLTINLMNPTNANPSEIGKMVRKEIMSALQGRVTTTVQRTR